RERIGAAPPANLELVCAADPPPGEVDHVALPLSARGEAEVAREWIQLGHERLRVGGILAASTDEPRDKWLDDQMRRVFPAVTRRPDPRGVVYVARKTAPLKRPIDFARRFAFRDRGRLIEAVSRPSVFAHGRIDPGARSLLEAVEVPAGARVLDMGCGSGVLSLAAALRAEGVRVHAVDSNARAVESVEAGARLNGIASITAERSASGAPRGIAPGEADLVLANPYYFSDFRIARLFVDAARAALRPGGRLALVTKAPEWYVETLPGAGFAAPAVREVKAYAVIEAARR
ncbi:MAG TPA: methyltransferase, partial [Planctomycetota bacterium]|nr:methyltransferase [Planctomycetota bacterium]